MRLSGLNYLVFPEYVGSGSPSARIMLEKWNESTGRFEAVPIATYVTDPATRMHARIVAVDKALFPGC